ncbi:low molecular weight protein-tyrosine-phosphatase [Lutimonas sp.]|uniref:low molecular weight protein-tyrosine-phosphatase n=1 Tax=Lutimonas sp. TaxID=1872403 RepID=UPI003D9B036B
MVKVLMVCLGNICRSPLAEGILKSKTDRHFVFVDSAGTGGWHVGELPDARSIEVARANGLDISDQRCRKFTRNDFEDFDKIYVMDKSNYSDVLALAQTKQEESKVIMILNESAADLNEEVPDPYYGGDNGFQHVYDLLNDACEQIANRLNHE